MINNNDPYMEMIEYHRLIEEAIKFHIRNKEIEDWILESKDHGYYVNCYVSKLMCGYWPEVEKMILEMGISIAIHYWCFAKKHRFWPELEKLMLEKDDIDHLKYYRHELHNNPYNKLNLLYLHEN